MSVQARLLERSQPTFVDRRAKVWLECTGEPYDRRSVKEIASSVSVCDVLVVRHVCPRCRRIHDSLLFR